MNGWEAAFAQWAGLGAGAGGSFFAVRWFLEWLSGRYDKRVKQIDDATQQLITTLDNQMKSLILRLDSAEEALILCKQRHAESETNVLRLEAIIMAQGEGRQYAQRVISAERMEEHEAKNSE